MQKEPLISIRDLHVSFGSVEVLHGIDLDIGSGVIHALIGESGSGKSVLARSILGLAGRNCRINGSIRFGNRELLTLSASEYRRLRGAEIAMVVQDAMSALNPMRTIGYQLMETIACRHPLLSQSIAGRSAGLQKTRPARYCTRLTQNGWNYGS